MGLINFLPGGMPKQVPPNDEVSHLLSILHKNAGGTTLDGATYNYDNAGKRKTRTPKPTGSALTFTYDNIYQPGTPFDKLRACCQASASPQS